VGDCHEYVPDAKGSWIYRPYLKQRALVPARVNPSGCNEDAVNPGMRHLRACGVYRSRNRVPDGTPAATASPSWHQMFLTEHPRSWLIPLAQLVISTRSPARHEG